jgi:hypothetical protein
MTANPDRLYELLPAIYRLRDGERGEPLRALLRVIAEQADVLEQDIDQLYDNWFIETCQDWLVPYIGDLVGYTPVAEAGLPSAKAGEEGRLLNKALAPRAEIANIVRYRRRKGTLALLEQLANDIAAWPARAVEYYALLGWTQNIKHLRPERGRVVDLRNSTALARLHGPFDETAHGVDLRRIHSRYQAGRYNLPSVGLFVWRLKAYSVTETPACCVEAAGPHCYAFSALGNDQPLYTAPQPESNPWHIAEELNLPVPIRRRAFDDNGHASPAYYGEGRSLAIWTSSWPTKNSPSLLPAELIIPADLSDWHYKPPRGKVAVDPLLGRIAFPPKQLPKKVWVSYRYGFSADMGGGEYRRPLRQMSGSQLIRVSGQEQLQKALLPWLAGAAADDQPVDAVVEIADSGVYVLPIALELKAGHSLQLRAAEMKRPIIRLLDWQTERPDSFSIGGGAGSRMLLDGLLIAGRGVLVDGELGSLIIRHSTLVPGWTLDSDCRPERTEASLQLINTQACVTIEHSIVGPVQVSLDEVNADPLMLRIADSIVDAGECTGAAGECEEGACEALGSGSGCYAQVRLSVKRSTILGCVNTHAIDLAEDSIFMGQVSVARRQIGCMRFCYVPPVSRTPRRFQCQPDMATRDLAGDEKLREQRRVKPQFNSQRYGTPSYCQLAHGCAEEITRGSEDQSEMGVFHDLFYPQRLANLSARLQEYTPAATDAGIIVAS